MPAASPSPEDSPFHQAVHKVEIEGPDSGPDTGNDPDRTDGPPRRRLGALIVLATLAIGLSWFLFDRTGEQDAEPITPETIDAAIVEALSTTTRPPPLGPAISQIVLPSTVFIQIGSGNNLRSIGSGVVANDEGDVLTAFHVVDGADTINVSFIDGFTTTAEVIETEPERDIAVLSLDQPPTVLVPAVLGGGTNIGAPVFAVGSPLGLVGSVTEGVISGLGRTVPISDGVSLDDLIQFDAAVNPGSSGGPLVDQAGQVIGIVTALANPSGEDSFTGIGFAVPIEIAAAAAGGPRQ